MEQAPQSWLFSVARNLGLNEDSFHLLPFPISRPLSDDEVQIRSQAQPGPVAYPILKTF